MRRIINFFKDVKVELFKVVWPTRKEAIRYTLIVIVFSVTLSIILGAADYGLLRGVEALVNR